MTFQPASTLDANVYIDPMGPNMAISVGQQALTLFSIPEEFLAYYSGFFHTQVENIMYGANPSGEIRLPGDNVETFTLAMSYLQRRVWMDVPMGMKETEFIRFDRIVDLWVFAEKKNMPIIQNAAADLFVMKMKEQEEIPDRWTVEFIWERTQPGAPIRRMLVDLIREMWIPEHKDKVWNELVGGMSSDPERLIGMMEQLINHTDYSVRVSGKTLRRMQSCEWHVHPPGVVCEHAEEAKMTTGSDEYYRGRYKAKHMEMIGSLAG